MVFLNLPAKIIFSEIGTDASLFLTSKKLCNWALLTPQNNKIVGKKKSTRVSRAYVYLKPTLVQYANDAIKSTKAPFIDNDLKALSKLGIDASIRNLNSINI